VGAPENLWTKCINDATEYVGMVTILVSTVLSKMDWVRAFMVLCEKESAEVMGW
jgi:hypothetical protein